MEKLGGILPSLIKCSFGCRWLKKGRNPEETIPKCSRRIIERDSGAAEKHRRPRIFILQNSSTLYVNNILCAFFLNFCNEYKVQFLQRELLRSPHAETNCSLIR